MLSPTTTEMKTTPRTALFTLKVAPMLLGIIFKITNRGLEAVEPVLAFTPSMCTLNSPERKYNNPIALAITKAMELVIINQPMVLADTRPKVEASVISLIAITTEQKTIGTIINCSARINNWPPI